MILALDTTREYGSIALVSGTEILEEIEIHSPTGFGQVLYQHLEALLTRHYVKVTDIDCFAAAAGPGSFTGVRVGLACIKGLAEATNKPAAAVSNLEALATFGQARYRVPIIDARRGEIYAAVYDAEGFLISPEVVTKLETLLQTLAAAPADLITQDALDLPIPVTHAPRAIAGAIGRLAESRAQDPIALDANYVRRSDAELFWKE